MKNYNIVFFATFFLIIGCRTNSVVNISEDLSNNKSEQILEIIEQNDSYQDSVFCDNTAIIVNYRTDIRVNNKIYGFFNISPSCVIEESFHGSERHIEFLSEYFQIVDHSSINIFNQIDKDSIVKFRGVKMFEILLNKWAIFHSCDEKYFLPCSSSYYIQYLLEMVKSIDGSKSFYQDIDELQLEYREGIDCECNQWEVTEKYIREKYNSGKVVLKNFSEI